MSKARQKASTTDQHARKLASAIAKGRLPALTPDLDRYLGESPREIFVAFDGDSAGEAAAAIGSAQIAQRDPIRKGQRKRLQAVAGQHS